jgi:hypothetical protein
VRVADFQEAEYEGMMGKVDGVLYYLFSGNEYVVLSRYVKI